MEGFAGSAGRCKKDEEEEKRRAEVRMGGRMGWDEDEKRWTRARKGEKGQTAAWGLAGEEPTEDSARA